jgi:RNA recognition motif-containing protein
MKLLVRNLSRNTTQAELLTLFQAHGLVQSCQLVLDKETGESKGFAFIEMPKPGDAKAAIKTLNNHELDCKKIRVKYAQSAPEDASTKEA